MNKLVVAFVLAAFLATLIMGVVEGENSMVATTLSEDIDSDDTLLYVYDAEDFPLNGTVIIGSEYIEYCDRTSRTMAVCDDGRGADLTTAQGHAAGVTVYTKESNLINSALGFNVAEVSTNAGALAVPMIIGHFFTDSLPRLVTWNYSFLKQGEVQYFRYFLITISTGFVLVFCFQTIAALGGIAQSVIARW